MDLSLHAATASRLTPILYEKFKGNPRRIKRFMNDLHIRQSIASKRGITLEADAIAKLMVLERLLKDDFGTILDWLAKGKLRPELERLERIADGDVSPQPPIVASPAPALSGRTRPVVVPAADAPPQPEPFSATMIRWGKLPPKLDATEVSGYLNLAAAFNGRMLIDESLPQQLRDLADALISSSQIDRNAIKDDRLRQLATGDVGELLAYLGRRMQDDPSIQLNTVNAIVKIATLHPSSIAAVKSALSRLPIQEVKAPTVLIFTGVQVPYADLLGAWSHSTNGPVQRAVTSVLGAATAHGN